jgi:cardiolipin synthase A/B
MEATIQTLLPILGNIVLWISIIGAIFVIIMENKNPIKTISWVIVIYFLPFAGLILYFFFGQDIRKKRMISKRIDHQVRDRMLEKFDSSELDRIDEKAHHFIQLLQGNNHALPFAGNKVEIYTTGQEKMDALFESIKIAKHHIHLQYFKIEDDLIGNELLALLAQKTKEGVKVRVMYDDAACWKVNKEFYERMKDEGIEVRGFLKVRFPLFANKINYRNHRKLVVIDG